MPKPGTRLQGLPKARMSVVGMNLGGSRPWNAVEGLEPTGGVSNYLVGPEKDWTGYSPIRPSSGERCLRWNRPGLLPSRRELEYDFVVEPGGDANQIRLAFDGCRFDACR